MHLSTKLTSISKEDTVTKLNEILDKAHVSINQWGQRVVSVDGYQGSVEINTLASKYLNAKTFSFDNSTLEERFECYELWERVEQLYADSDLALQKNLVSRFLATIRESACCSPICSDEPFTQDVRDIICGPSSNYNKSTLLRFSRETFQETWPNAKPESKTVVRVGDTDYEQWTASKELVAETLNNLELDTSTSEQEVESPISDSEGIEADPSEVEG